MNEKLEQINNSFQYAIKHGIDPVDPSTWDDAYKQRMRQLAGVLPSVTEELKKIQEGIDSLIG